MFFLNEARIVHENHHFNTRGKLDGPRITDMTSPIDERRNPQRVAIGGSPDRREREQTGFTLRDDLTYTGRASHVLNSGAKRKAMRYNLDGASRAVDLVETIVDLTTGPIFFDGTNCTSKSTNDVAAPMPPGGLWWAWGGTLHRLAPDATSMALPLAP